MGRIKKILRLLFLLLKLVINRVAFGVKLRGNRVIIKNRGRIILGNKVSLNSYPGGDLYKTGLLTYFEDAVIIIGNNCILNGTIIHCNTSVKIGNDCMFGPGTKIVDNDSHRISIDVLERRKAAAKIPINIEDNVWVGMNSLILKGVKIGKNSIIAAHSVVTKDVPENVIVGGNPAKVIKHLSK